MKYMQLSAIALQLEHQNVELIATCFSWANEHFAHCKFVNFQPSSMDENSSIAWNFFPTNVIMMHVLFCN
jgi:homogentisate 1,2-dioxygenase